MNGLTSQLTTRLSLAMLMLWFSGITARPQDQQLARYADTVAGEHVGEVATITGRVAIVAKSKGGATYLNFGGRFPLQTFSAVIFPQDQEKVGNVQQFDGKNVAITGKIELSRERKPQTIVKSASQIGLMEQTPGTDGTPTVVPPGKTGPPASADQRTPAPPGKSSPLRKRIVLGAAWNSPTQSGEMTRKDLATIFSGRGKASDATEGDPTIIVYPEIPFLTPLNEAKRRLKLEGTGSTKKKVVCPGMPLDSFWTHTFAGVFLGGFDRLCLMTDGADQVVSVQLVEDTSRHRSSDITDLAGYHTYNFVSYRVKGADDLVIKHEVGGTTPGVVVVESTLIDPNDNENPPVPRTSSKTSSKTQSRTPRTGKVLERSRWFVPAPIVNLILRCAENR